MTTTIELKRDFSLPEPTEARSQLIAIQVFQRTCRELMVSGVDYGIIPGTGTKPTLLKPGAEKLVRILGLADEYDVVEKTEDWEKGFFHYLFRCRLIHLASGLSVTQGMGECNSMESKYRWRNASRVCPNCQQEAIIRGRNFQTQTAEGWFCFPRKGGCGAKWPDGAQEIENQQTGRVPNDDIYTQVNTILKMGKKRALVDAALSAGRLSEVFTQDLEDLIDTPSTTVDAPGQHQDSRTAPKAAQVAPKATPAPKTAPRQPQVRSYCEIHNKVDGRMPDGRMGHPMPGESPCYADERHEPAIVNEAEPQVPAESDLTQEQIDAEWQALHASQRQEH